jgi:hypothetical protein
LFAHTPSLGQEILLVYHHFPLSLIAFSFLRVLIFIFLSPAFLPDRWKVRLLYPYIRISRPRWEKVFVTGVVHLILKPFAANSLQLFGMCQLETAFPLGVR